MRESTRSILQHPGMPVRSDLRAGRAVCYEEINGIWYPTYDSNNPPVPVVPTPNPPSTPGVHWLDCQSCTGTQIIPGQLSSANCEVCNL